MNRDIAVVLVAGGIGTRMLSNIPKQFLHLKSKPIACYSFDIFNTVPGVSEIVVVCAKEYRHFFNSQNTKIKITFAEPGARRQDSVYNGFQAIQSASTYVCVHDSARPCITVPMVQRVIAAACEHGAATAGMPVKFTVKESNADHFVAQTPDRSRIWEIQTPQIIKREWLQEGFAYAQKHNLTVTDDVSLVELIKKPVKLVEGSHSNLKITVPEDWAIIEQMISHMSN